MSKQPPPSAEAIQLASNYEGSRWELAKEIDALCERRVSAERERSHRVITAATPPSPATVVDYTERAQELYADASSRYREPSNFHAGLVENIAAALSAVASERDAAHAAEVEQAYRVGKTFGSVEALAEHQAEIASIREQVHFFQVQYQDEIGINGLREERDAALAEIAALKHDLERAQAAASSEAAAHSALLARLREPHVRRTLANHIAGHRQHGCNFAEGTCAECQGIADAAIAKIAEMLTP